MSFERSMRLGHAVSRWLPVLALCVLGAACSSKKDGADAQLRAIYTTEWKWRQDQFADGEDAQRPIPDHLPRVDPATQEIRLKYWEQVLEKLKSVRREDLSAAERLNLDIYRPQIE